MEILKHEKHKNIYLCDLFLEAKENLYKKFSKEKEQYDKWLDRQLAFLDAEGLNVLLFRPAVFEKLSGVENLYAITRREFPGNPRVLFFVLEEDEPMVFLLVVAFKELSSGDYKRNIPVAIERRKIIMESLKEEDGYEYKK